MIALKNGKLTVDGVVFSLDSLRLVYMFFPTGFKWHLLNPSEWLYPYQNVDSFSEDSIRELQEKLSSLPKFAQSEFRYVLKDFDGHYAKVNMKDLSAHGVDLLPALLEHRLTRQERLVQWLALDPSVDIMSPNKRMSVTMSKQGVLWHYNQTMLLWQDYERIEGSEKGGLGWKRAFTIHYFPRRGRASKGVMTEVANDEIEHFLAEHHFWMTTGLGLEGLEDLRLYKEEREKAAKRSRRKLFVILILLTIVITTALVCVLAITKGF